MTKVTIHGQRGAEWESIAGTRTFPVLGPVPFLATLPGLGERRVFLLDLKAVDADTLLRIARHLKSKFGLTEEEAAREIQAAGIPILEEDCSVCTDLRDFL
jgi:hypothetical protein